MGYTVLGLPNAALLAVAAGLFEIVPMIGPFLAFAPAVVVTLTVSPGTAVVGSALYGLPGAFLVVPVAGAIQVVLAHTLRAEDPAQAEEPADPHERLQQQVGSHGPAAEAVAANP